MFKLYIRVCKYMKCPMKISVNCLGIPWVNKCNTSSDHYCIETVAPSGYHCFTDTVAPSSDHYCVNIVAPSSDHYCIKKVI